MAVSKPPRTIIAIALGAVITFAGSIAPAQAKTGAEANLTDTENVARTQNIADTVYFDLRNESFGVDVEHAERIGFTQAEIDAANGNLRKMSNAEAVELAETIGLDVAALRMQRAVPLVIKGIASAVGVAAGEEIISQVTNWGVSGACRNLEGRWAAFDDFCRSNGHI